MRQSALDVALNHNFVLVDSGVGGGLFRLAFDEDAGRKIFFGGDEVELGRIAGFTEIKIPGMAHERTDIRSDNEVNPTPVLSGRGTISELTLQRGVFWRNTDFYVWFTQASLGFAGSAPRRNLRVYQLDHRKAKIVRGYHLLGCIPTAVDFPTLTADGGVSIESLTIAVKGIRIIS